MLHKQPPLPNESEFPNGIILGPPCGSLSGPLLKGRPQGGVSCAQFQRCWRDSPPTSFARIFSPEQFSSLLLSVAVGNAEDRGEGLRRP